MSAFYGTVGTAASRNTGTSGATIPLLNAANTWSALQSYSSGISCSTGAGVTAAHMVGPSGAQVYVDFVGTGDHYHDANSSIFRTIAGAQYAKFSTAGAAIASSPPASAAAAGVAGTITWDASFIYVCTATNTWKRVAIATW